MFIEDLIIYGKVKNKLNSYLNFVFKRSIELIDTQITLNESSIRKIKKSSEK
jgi:hypothetical protein